MLGLLLCLLGLGCSQARAPGLERPDPDDFPTALTIPGAPKITGTTTIEFIETSDALPRRFARIVFFARWPESYVVANPIVISESDMLRFVSGERIALAETSEPLGYGSRAEDDTGFPTSVMTWRPVRALELESTAQGEIVIHLELGDANDDLGEVVSEGSVDASLAGRVDITCVPANGQADPLFSHDPFCIGIWNDAGGLGHLSDGFAAR